MDLNSPGQRDIQLPKPSTHEAYEPSYIDKTTFHPDQAHWTIDNLPAVLYVLRPGTQYSKSRARIRSTSKAIFGRYVREFLVLPAQISTQVEGWRLESWWRLDRRIEAQDILDRMNPGIRAHHGIEESELEMRRQRFRCDFRVADWRSQISINDLTRRMKIEGFDPVSTNNTRGITPGLIDPEKGESAGRIPISRAGDAYTGPRPLSFVLRGLEKPASNARVMSSDGILSNTPLPRKEARPAMNPYQCLGQGLLPRYTPPCLPSFQSPRSQKRVASGPIGPVMSSPQKRRATINGNIPVVNGQGVIMERQKRATYPDMQCELASHQGTPVFREQNVTNDGGIMTLEEYLNRNQMTFDEYLCCEEGEKKKEKQGTGTRRANGGQTFVTTPTKGNVVDPWLTVL